MNAPMKTKNHDELDDSPSIFAGAACRRHHPFSKTNPFADISAGVAESLKCGAPP
jgi:hypothetical protein